MGETGRYGQLGRPEHSDSVHQKIDSFRALESIHKNYASLCRKMIPHVDDFWYEFDNLVDYLYVEACRLFRETGITEYDSRQVADYIRNSNTGYADGLFLSAMLNTTEMDELAIDGSIVPVHIGYRLGSGKMLALGKNITSPVIGKYSMGRIINHGRVNALSPQAVDGVHINTGRADVFGFGSDKGVYINAGKSQEAGWGMGGSAVHVNLGEVDRFGLGGQQTKVVAANFSRINFTAGYNYHGLLYSAGPIMERSAGFPKGRHCLFESGDDEGLDVLAGILRRESKKALVFKGVSDIQEIAKAAKEFDFEWFKNKVERAAEAMEKYADGMYGIK